MTKNSYELKLTEDGSQTLHSPLFGEDCHSCFGAITETQTYYIKGCEIKEKLSKYQSINILEVGFGIGVGLKTTYEETKGQTGIINFTSLELDRDLLKFIREKNLLEGFSWTEKTDSICLTRNHIQSDILIGDARVTVPQIKDKKFHAIYQDAFSPKKNPRLWTVEWFRLLKDLAHDDCILSTYSASSSIRKSLIEAGWVVRNGLKFAGKRSSTIATLQGEHDLEIIEHLKRSPVPLIWDDSTDEFIKMR